MEPSKDFVRDLKNISQNLSVYFEKILERWVIDYKSPNGQVHRVFEVKNPDGSYRPLDQRTIDLVKKSDMSSKIKDISYYLSEQYQKMKEYKAKARQTNRDNALQKAKGMGNKKWRDALDNAYRGIYHPTQLDRKIFSIPNSTFDLLKRYGMPALSKKAIEINPNKE